VYTRSLSTIVLHLILLTMSGSGRRETARTPHKLDKNIGIACHGMYDADLILSTLAGSVWIGVRLADISWQSVSSEAQEARLRPCLSCGINRHLTLLVVW
jgi:hypothetical protein